MKPSLAFSPDPEKTNRFQVAGTAVDAVQPAEVMTKIENWIQSKSIGHYITFTGMHGVVEARENPSLMQAQKNASLVVPDGMPLVWMGRLAGFFLRKRVDGPSFMPFFCKSTGRKYRHFLYGGDEGVAEALAKVLTERYGNRVVGTICPPFRDLSSEEQAQFVNQIKNAKPDIIWVGLSTPKQEIWMHKFSPVLGVPVLCGVGAAYDFLIGRKARAPRWIRENGFEWLFRLATEPRRLWRRYLLGGTRFIFLCLEDILYKKNQTLNKKTSPVLKTSKKLNLPNLAQKASLIRQKHGSRFITLTDQAIVSLANFTTSIMIARYIGLSDYGLYVLLWGAVLFLCVFQNSLINAPLYHFSSRRQAANAYYANLFAIELLGLAVVLTVVASVFLNFPIFPLLENRGALIGLTAITGAYYLLQDFIRRSLFALERPLLALINDSINSLSQIILLFLLHRSGHFSLQFVLVIMAGTSLFAIFIGLLQLNPNFKKVSFRGMKKCAQLHWHYGRWLLFGQNLAWIWSSLPNYIVAYLWGSQATGILRSIQNFILALNVLFLGVGNFLPKLFSNLYRTRQTLAFRAVFFRSLFFIMGLSAVYWCTLSISPETLLRLLYGEALSGKGTLLVWFAGDVILYAAEVPLAAALRGLKNTRAIFMGHGVTVLVAAVITIPLIRWHGILGSIQALLVLHLVYITVLAIFLGQNLKKTLEKAEV